MPYLCVHFREKLTPDGEQVYFAISRNGYDWTAVNGGRPVLKSSLSCKGVRDIEIVRRKEGGFVIIATDLCIVHRMDENHNVDWKDINHNGSRLLAMWESDDLVSFSAQKMLDLHRDDFGCMWAPEVFYDEKDNKYLLHWGSTVKEDGYNHMSIYCSETRDFKEFTPPRLYFTKKNEILDSHICKVGDTYHLFYKNAEDPSMNMHETSENLYGPFTHDNEFDSLMASLEKPGSYEAATEFTLPDGKWCLMLDFFGCEKDKMGYVPFVSETEGDAHFVRSPEKFTFPYGFKHGRFLEITEEEYTGISNASY